MEQGFEEAETRKLQHLSSRGPVFRLWKVEYDKSQCQSCLDGGQSEDIHVNGLFGGGRRFFCDGNLGLIGRGGVNAWLRRPGRSKEHLQFLLLEKSKGALLGAMRNRPRRFHGGFGLGFF